MGNISSKDRVTVYKIIDDMVNSTAVQFMFEQTEKLGMESFRDKWLRKRYVDRMNFTPKQLTIARMVYNRQCKANKEKR